MSHKIWQRQTSHTNMPYLYPGLNPCISDIELQVVRGWPGAGQYPAGSGTDGNIADEYGPVGKPFWEDSGNDIPDLLHPLKEMVLYLKSIPWYYVLTCLHFDPS